MGATIPLGTSKKRKGKVQMKPRSWVPSSHFHEGLAPVRIGDRFGYIDTKGNFLMTPRYQWAGEFFRGRAFVNLDGQLVMIDKWGHHIAELGPFCFASSFSQGLASILFVANGDLLTTLENSQFH